MPKKKPEYSPTVQAKLDEIREARKVYEKAMKTHGKTLVKEMASEFMQKFPEVEGIQWQQYTPYFNDGDACEFSIHEPHVRFTQEFLDSFSDEDKRPFYEMGDGFYELATYRDDCPARVKEMSNSLSQFYIAIQELEQSLLECFGDHMEITILRDGKVRAEEYSHD
jgi:hypothetical protein